MEALKQKETILEEYFALPETTMAELIDGEIRMMASPSRRHQEMLGALYSAIYNHIKAHGGDCKVYPAPFSVKLEKEKDNYLEPDISVICDRDKLTDAGCEGAPDWIIEIASPGDLRHDYIKKLNLYEDAGVREYWIVDPMEERVTTYLLEEDKFKVQAFSFTDVVPSGIWETFSIDFAQISADAE